MNTGIEFGRSGAKKQHLKIICDRHYDDFDSELPQIQQFTQTFFDEMVKNIPLIDNK